MNDPELGGTGVVEREEIQGKMHAGVPALLLVYQLPLGALFLHLYSTNTTGLLEGHRRAAP